MLFSVHIYYFILYFFTQTLTDLCLRENKIGHEGIRYLADVLRDNKVILSSIDCCNFYLHFLIQTLTKLDVGNNKMGDEGAKYLGDALKNNTVNVAFSSSVLFASLLFHTDNRRTRC
jgi:Ran GTPase-activating protein (RanGAP) involved in mRNA processing and transport